MQVRFKRPFFAPGGRRLRKNVWYELPEDIKLPKGAEVKDESLPEAPPPLFSKLSEKSKEA